MSASAAQLQRLHDLVGQVPDPELPQVTIAELGVLREVRDNDGVIEVLITPTYSGCPALDAIREDIEATLRAQGLQCIAVRTVLSPAWSSDWITPVAREKLRAAGIAPPAHAAGEAPMSLRPRCPQCGSFETEQLSEFGSTACKALYRCTRCREPFDYFKVL